MFTLLRVPKACALLLAASLTILSNTLISPALPAIEIHFAGGAAAGVLSRLLVTAPSLLVALSAPFAGAMADRYGRRRQLLFGTVLFALSGTAGLWLPTLELILASRLVLGASVALIMTAQTALIADTFSGQQRSRFMGLQISATNFSGLLFLTISGILAGLSALAPFAIYGVALLYLPLFLRTLHDKPPAASAMPTDTVQQGHPPGWQITAGAVLLLALLSMVCLYILPTQASYFLAERGMEEPAVTGAFLGMVTFAGGLASLCFTRMTKSLGAAGTAALGFLMMAAGFLTLALPFQGLTAFAGGMFCGASVGLLMPVFLSVALDTAPVPYRGRISGALTAAIFFGQFLSPILCQPAVDGLGFIGLFVVVALVLCVAAGVAFRTFKAGSEAS